MADLQLTHIALVGARMNAFSELGYHSRDDLAMRRIAPAEAVMLQSMQPSVRRSLLQEQLPLWVHNIITDQDFPRRTQLLMPMRRFEGELLDRKTDEVVSTVLSRGFGNQNFDPMQLPAELPLRERVTILAHIEVWKDAYNALEQGLLDILVAQAEALDQWTELARQPAFSLIE